jgi:hypothetical protein
MLFLPVVILIGILKSKFYVSGRTKKGRLRKLGHFPKIMIIRGNPRYYL